LGGVPDIASARTRPGGRLVVVQPALDDNGWSGYEELCDHTNAALAEMVEDGLITPDERTKMVLGALLRRKCDLLAPFQRDGGFQNLHVESCELAGLPDPAWADYMQDGNAEAVAAQPAPLNSFLTATVLIKEDGT
jgi:hypothetical protein